jgi:hypothetical protein
LTENFDSESEEKPRTAIEEVDYSVDQFSNANQVVFVLSIIGAIVIAIVGLVPQCPPLSPFCYDSEKVANFSLIAVGIAAGIASWWIWSFGRMVSSRVALAANQAK